MALNVRRARRRRAGAAHPRPRRPTPRRWRRWPQALAGEARVIAYDRRGYGASGAPGAVPSARRSRSRRRTPPRCCGALDAGPAVVCGDGFGALVALDLAKRHRRARPGRRRSPTRRCSCSSPRRPSALARPARRSSRRRCASGGPEAGRRGLARRARRRPAALERARAAHRGLLRRLRRPGELAGHAPRAARAGRCPPSCSPGRASPPHVVAAADALAGAAARRAAAPTTATSWPPRAALLASP